MMDRHRARNRIEIIAELTEFDHLPRLPAIDNQWQSGITTSLNEYCLYGAETDDIRIGYVMTDDWA
jgi:hypothetical protein